MSIVSPRARPDPGLRIRRRRIANQTAKKCVAHSLPQLKGLHRVSLSQRACFFACSFCINQHAEMAPPSRKGKEKRARSELPDPGEHGAPFTKSVQERAALGHQSLVAIAALPTDGEAWETAGKVITVAVEFFEMFGETNAQVIAEWLSPLKGGGWKVLKDQEWGPIKKNPSAKARAAILLIAARFFTAYETRFRPLRPDLHESTSRATRTPRILHSWRRQRGRQRQLPDHLAWVGGGLARPGLSTDNPHPVDRLACSSVSRERAARGRPHQCQPSSNCARANCTCSA